jgi:DNA-binding LytR/AlgR family response regulator
MLIPVFVRVNREAVVNLGCVKEVQRPDSKRLLFIMEGGAEFVASRKGTMEFRRKFSL